MIIATIAVLSGCASKGKAYSKGPFYSYGYEYHKDKYSAKEKIFILEEKVERLQLKSRNQEQTIETLKTKLGMKKGDAEQQSTPYEYYQLNAVSPYPSRIPPKRNPKYPRLLRRALPKIQQGSEEPPRQFRPTRLLTGIMTMK